MLALVWLCQASNCNAEPAPAAVAFTQSGTEETVFRWRKDRCDNGDIPDAAARAFRDRSGQVHLIASSDDNRALIGPTLEQVRRDCHVVYRAAGRDAPSDFDDKGWLESFYTSDGVNVLGLVAMDYHPDRHRKRCGAAGMDAGKCWYAAVTATFSTDGGRTFGASRDGQTRLVVAPDRRFDPDKVNTVGALVPSNIVKKDAFYYFLVSFLSDDRGRDGEYLLRSADPADISAWRGWDGSGFSVVTRDPYKATSVAGPTYAPLPDLRFSPVRSLLAIKGGFLAISIAPDYLGRGLSAVVGQTSADLFHWSRPTLVMQLPLYTPRATSRGPIGYYYPSILDGQSHALNFDCIGSEPFLYLTKIRFGKGLDRDLVRFPLKMIYR